MTVSNYNPDVLSCLANLSNDEVFTPPGLANQMLDLLPVELWHNKDARFLDPVCKSGVFLREIAKRLMNGLATQIPDPKQRANHIFKNQLFGIAITELTGLMSRRTVYCSKYANGSYSICDNFKDEQGNIIFERIDHTWKDSKCVYCNASQKEYDRGEDLETYAYQFIHLRNSKFLFPNMKFDVIIGNPPYQLSDGGHGASAKPIYHNFVKQAIKLAPRYLTMIIPSRWFLGGRVGELSDFRQEMLHDSRLRVLHDFFNAGDCFPGVEIKGGVNYFLWDRDNRGNCTIHSHDNGKTSVSVRPLLEKGIDSFIRRNEAISIVKKVISKKEKSFADLVSANDPFGFDEREENSMKRVRIKFELDTFKNSSPYYYNGWRKEGLGYIDRKKIKRNIEWVDQYKIFVPKAIGSGDSKTDHVKPICVETGGCCSETYLVIGPFQSVKTMNNVAKYIDTKFFHFLLSIKKITQEARRGVYSLIPMQDFSITWTDKKLYQKYSLTEEEIDFIEAIVRPINSDNDE